MIIFKHLVNSMSSLKSLSCCNLHYLHSNNWTLIKRIIKCNFSIYCNLIVREGKSVCDSQGRTRLMDIPLMFWQHVMLSIYIYINHILYAAFVALSTHILIGIYSTCIHVHDPYISVMLNMIKSTSHPNDIIHAASHLLLAIWLFHG